MAQWLERGALSISLPAVQFRIPLGAGFSEKHRVSFFSILVHCFDVLSLAKALYLQMHHLTRIGWKWISGRTEVTMCTISSMRKMAAWTTLYKWFFNSTVILFIILPEIGVIAFIYNYFHFSVFSMKKAATYNVNFSCPFSRILSWNLYPFHNNWKLYWYCTSV